MKRAKNLSLVLSLFVASAAAVLFQNCGKGFQAAVPMSYSSSAQCVAKLRSGEVELNLASVDLRCNDAQSYVCERRVFRPGLPNETRVEQWCDSSHGQCVDVTVRQFDSNAARTAGGDESGFVDGGEFNREEVKCNHVHLHNGISPFEGEGADIKSSLAGARAACNAAEEKGS